jgi:hypothetical protein
MTFLFTASLPHRRAGAGRDSKRYLNPFDYINTLTTITTLTGSKRDLPSTMTATARVCLEPRFYDYLASSEVDKKLSSKLVTVTLSS